MYRSSNDNLSQTFGHKMTDTITISWIAWIATINFTSLNVIPG